MAARIDSQARVLYKRRGDARAQAFHSALRTGEEHLRGTKALLLRASLVQ